MKLLKKKKVLLKKKKVPTLVKVISVFYYIGAFLGLLFGILFMVGAKIVYLILDQIPELAALGSGIFVVLGVILIVMSVVDFFIGVGLWNGKRWARIWVIIFCALGILSAIINGILVNLGSLIINLAIGLYFYLDKDVKKAFN